MFGYYTYYERKCNKCGHSNSYAEYKGSLEESPIWVKEAEDKKLFKEIYWNANI